MANGTAQTAAMPEVAQQAAQQQPAAPAQPPAPAGATAATATPPQAAGAAQAQPAAAAGAGNFPKSHYRHVVLSRSVRSANRALAHCLQTPQSAPYNAIGWMTSRLHCANVQHRDASWDAGCTRRCGGTRAAWWWSSSRRTAPPWRRRLRTRPCGCGMRPAAPCCARWKATPRCVHSRSGLHVRP